MRKKFYSRLIFVFLFLFTIIYISPYYIVFVSSFKPKTKIIQDPFSLPEHLKFSLTYYKDGVEQVELFTAFKNSLFITVLSVLTIVIFTAIAAWMLVRMKTKTSKIIYYTFLAAMVVPFQLVMFPMIYTATNWFNLTGKIGIIVLYLGFGASLSIFLFYGFIKGIPYELEEAAFIDGCNPLQTFIYIVFPILKPISITVAILNTIWIWNDYLLPKLLLEDKDRTIPVAIQYLVGSRGSVDFSPMMANVTLAVIPVIIFYFALQKYIIKGITAGSIK